MCTLLNFLYLSIKKSGTYLKVFWKTKNNSAVESGRHIHAATKQLYLLMTFWEWLRNRAFHKSRRKALDKGIQNDCFFLHNWNLFIIIWLDFLIHRKHFKWNSAKFTTWHFRSSRSLTISSCYSKTSLTILQLVLKWLQGRSEDILRLVSFLNLDYND